MKIVKGLWNRLLAVFGVWWKLWMRTFGFGGMKRSVLRRRGVCLRCGGCCSGCPKLLGNNLCGDWVLANQLGCVLFPISRFDQKRLGVEDKCGFYWEDVKE